MDIIEKFGALPSLIFFEGCTFELMLIKDVTPDDVRLCYRLMSVDRESENWILYRDCGRWLNPFNNRLEGFLILHENIADQWDLACAIERVEIFLLENNLK